MPALPTGTILLWSGSVASIPAGFVLCDGNNGTPNLKDRFVIGAGGTHAVGANGGTTQHTHTYTGDGHQHLLPVGAQVQTGGGYDVLSGISNDSGTTQNANHLPPYFALAYIMKT